MTEHRRVHAARIQPSTFERSTGRNCPKFSGMRVPEGPAIPANRCTGGTDNDDAVQGHDFFTINRQSAVSIPNRKSPNRQPPVANPQFRKFVPRSIPLDSKARILGTNSGAGDAKYMCTVIYSPSTAGHAACSCSLVGRRRSGLSIATADAGLPRAPIARPCSLLSGG